MNEASLSDSLSKAGAKAMPGLVDFKHFDRVTEGMPDRSWTWGGRTVWLELKYHGGQPSPAQIVTMRLLARAGMAYYIRFDYHLREPVTLIIHPTGRLEVQIPGHDVRKTADWIRKKIEELR